MIITFISDTHNDHRKLTDQLPGGDLLIHSGDMTATGTTGETYDFLDWFEAAPYTKKIFTPGNHDFYFEDITLGGIFKKEREQRLMKLVNSYPSIRWSQDDTNFCLGLKIHASPWQPTFNDWAYNLPRGGEELKAKWDLIPEGLDILITHGPPLGRGDKLDDGMEVGDNLLLNAVLQTKPIIHVFGHIHAGRGMYESPDTTFINASNMTEQYRLVHPPITIDYNLETKTFEVL